MIKTHCFNCSKQLTRSPSKVEPRNFCSRQCYSVIRNEELVIKGKNFAFKKGRTEIPNRIEAMHKLSGKNHYAWKGQQVSYRGLHQWIKRIKGLPKKCLYCGKESAKPRIIQWANIDGKYRRHIDDFIPLCVSCHKIHDLQLKPIQGVKFANQQHSLKIL